MPDYEKFMAEVKSALAEDRDLKITAADIEHFSPQQIMDIRKVIDDYSIAYVNKALRQKLITKEAADYLKGIFGNSMETTRSIYKNVSETLLRNFRPHKLKRLAELGEEPSPDEINAIDLETGKVEENTGIDGHDNMKRYKEYRVKHITPFTNMRLTFYDFRDNPVYVIMPGLKNVRRAIDKIKMPVVDKKTGKVISHGGKYYNQYQAEVQNCVRLAVPTMLCLKEN